VTNVV
jgi:hypothetical protein